MRTLLLAAVAVAALGSASAYAGEGNGPSFPGLNAVSSGITTSFVDGAATSVPTTTLYASANGAFQALPAQRATVSRPQRMIATLSGAYAG